MNRTMSLQEINNPFRRLWIWVGINVASQVINTFQSGFLLDAVPPQCWIVHQNGQSSNLISLVFVLFTLYLGYGATLWYVLYTKLIQATTAIDRTVLYSQEYKEGGVELFIPSKGETISFQ
jgi:hypothetical protein